MATREEHVRSTRVTGRDGDLQSDCPAGMRSRGYGLRERELPRVPEANGGHRVEAPPDLVSTCGGQPAAHVQRGLVVPTLNSTDRVLAKAGTARQLLLRETSCNASDAELVSEACSEVARPGSSCGPRMIAQVLHGSRMDEAAYHACIGPLSAGRLVQRRKVGGGAAKRGSGAARVRPRVAERVARHPRAVVIPLGLAMDRGRSGGARRAVAHRGYEDGPGDVGGAHHHEGRHVADAGHDAADDDGP